MLKLNMEEIKNADNIQSDIKIDQPLLPKNKKTKIPKHILILLIIIGLVSVASTTLAVYFYSQINTTKNNSNSNIQTIITVTPESSEADNNSNIVWLEKPQLTSNPKVFNQTNVVYDNDNFGIYFNKMTTYLIGKLEDGSEILKVIVPADGLGDEYKNICHLIKSSEGKISLLGKEQLNCNLSNYLLPEIGVSPISVKEFNLPEVIQYKNLTFNKGYFTSRTLDQLVNPKLIGITDYGNIYVVYTQKKALSDVYIQSFYLELKDKTLYSFDMKSGILKDDYSTNVSWLDNSSDGDRFNSRLTFEGCGNSFFGNEIIKDGSDLIKDKVEVGNFGSSKIYQIKDVNNSLVKTAYSLYKESNGSSNDTLSINDFVNTKNHFLYQDGLGDWVIYINQSYTLIAECGKPVIYLYPTKETQVKVQVGAQITKSEPTYPKAGWLVTAKPNGELTYQNQSYPYLFWEGLGNGIYPDYQDHGTLVSQKDLVSTVYKQLSQLGLNQKESADFMEFWQPRLPKTPYIRLTWLNTKDMDTLAPLNVYPKPDTNIRIFLEFEGLEKPVILKPQKLTAPARFGFTLIEWGGLLINPAK